jgi:O-methyltransferase
MEIKADNIAKSLLSSDWLTYPRKWVRVLIHYLIKARSGVILYYNNPELEYVLGLARRTEKESGMLLSLDDAYYIYSVTRATAKISGDIAEVGAYRGGSSKLICEAKGDRTLHLFDTFEGLPELTAHDDAGEFYPGLFKTGLDEIKAYLTAYKNVHFYKGLFPETASPIQDKNFSFVHLDADLYKSTLDSLEFFYPRMNRGGIIISHDYHSSGVRAAFDEFFKDKPEALVKLFTGRQCLVVKI